MTAAAMVVVAATEVASTLLMSGFGRTAEVPPTIPQGFQHGYLRSAGSTLCGLRLDGLRTVPDVLFPYLGLSAGEAVVCGDCREAAVRDGLTMSAPGRRRVPGRYRDGGGLRGDVLRAVIDLGADVRIRLGDRLVGWHVDSQNCVDFGGEVLRLLAEVGDEADPATRQAVREVVDRFVERYPQWRDLIEVTVLDRGRTRTGPGPQNAADGEPPSGVPWFLQPGRAWPFLGPPLAFR